MTGPLLRAREWCGRTWDDPSEETLHALLADLNLTHRFVVVERLGRRPRGHHSMRVHLNDDLSYRVEYREGGADRHFWAHVPRPPEMLAPPARRRDPGGLGGGAAGVARGPAAAAVVGGGRPGPGARGVVPPQARGVKARSTASTRASV